MHLISSLIWEVTFRYRIMTIICLPVLFKFLNLLINLSWLSADGILLGGIFIMYELHRFLRPILLLMYSFWIPQIVTNVVRDSRKPLHIYYILGITVTRLAIPMYVFGCPHNFMRIQPDKTWCICLGVFTSLQVAILLLQHYLGSRWFIPRQVRID